MGICSLAAMTVPSWRRRKSHCLGKNREPSRQRRDDLVQRLFIKKPLITFSLKAFPFFNRGAKERDSGKSPSSLWGNCHAVDLHESLANTILGFKHTAE
jgi:hypothetical protein